jgi:hypothetical protein
LQAVWRSEKLSASILQQLCECLVLSICAVDSKEWHRDDGYDLEADTSDLLNLSPDPDNDNRTTTTSLRKVTTSSTS